LAKTANILPLDKITIVKLFKKFEENGVAEYTSKPIDEKKLFLLYWKIACNLFEEKKEDQTLFCKQTCFILSIVGVKTR